MESSRALHLVNTETGEITETCAGCRARDEEIRGLETEKRGWRTRYYNLEREVEDAWQGHQLFPEAKRLFDFWRERCNHPRSQFTPDRFEQCKSHLRDLGPDLCRRAIEGIAYDPFVTVRRNGTSKRHDDWSLLFRNREKVEEYANKAPYHLPDPEKVKILAQAIQYIRLGTTTADAVAEAQRRLTR